MRLLLTQLASYSLLLFRRGRATVTASGGQLGPDVLHPGTNARKHMSTAQTHQWSDRNPARGKSPGSGGG